MVQWSTESTCVSCRIKSTPETQFLPDMNSKFLIPGQKWCCSLLSKYCYLRSKLQFAKVCTILRWTCQQVDLSTVLVLVNSNVALGVFHLCVKAQMAMT